MFFPKTFFGLMLVLANPVLGTPGYGESLLRCPNPDPDDPLPEPECPAMCMRPQGCVCMREEGGDWVLSEEGADELLRRGDEATPKPTPQPAE